MKKTIIFVFVVVSQHALASKLTKFSQSLEDRLLIDLSHLNVIENRIKIRTPNVLERWMMNKTGAEATYNDKTNVIVLRKKNFVKNRIISRSDLDESKKYSFIVLASTIFHELAHADFDTVISNDKSPINKTLFDIQKWFKRNVNLNSKIAAHEFFGYSAGESLMGLDNEISDILLQHRINPQTLKCFGRSAHAKEFSLSSEKNYIDFFTPDFIFIKGKDLDLRKIKFPYIFRKEVYSYFSKRYNFPSSRRELIDILNKSKYFNILLSCNSN